MASLAIVASAAQAANTGVVKCGSGQTVFHRGSTRAFMVEKTDSQHLSYQVVFACLSRRGHPHLHVLYYGEVGTDTSVDLFHLTGEHLGFHVHVSGGTSFDDYLGWIDTRTGSVRTGHISEGPGEAGEEVRGPTVPDGTLAYAIAADGAIAVIGTESPAQEVGLLVPGRRSFKALRTLALKPAGGLNEHFIQISASTVTCRTTQGAPVSISR